MRDFLTLFVVKEEPAFLRRMREGLQQEDNKVEEERRRRASEEVIDEDEAPQVVIQDKDKDKINENEARAFVIEKAGVKVEKAKNEMPKLGLPAKSKEENVSLGMKRTKRPNEGLKRSIEDEKDTTTARRKSQNSVLKKGKKVKLSFDEEE
jgi:hypothetical protein